MGWYPLVPAPPGPEPKHEPMVLGITPAATGVSEARKPHAATSLTGPRTGRAKEQLNDNQGDAWVDPLLDSRPPAKPPLGPPWEGGGVTPQGSATMNLLCFRGPPSALGENGHATEVTSNREATPAGP